MLSIELSCHSGHLFGFTGKVLRSITQRCSRTAQKENSFHTSSWMPGLNLLYLTTMQTLTIIKAEYRQENMQERHATRCAFQKPISNGLSRQSVRRYHTIICQVSFQKCEEGIAAFACSDTKEHCFRANED